MLINSVVTIHAKESILKPNDYLSQNNTGKMYIDPEENNKCRFGPFYMA